MGRYRLQRPNLGKEKKYGHGQGWRGKYHVYVAVDGALKRRGREVTLYKEKWKTKTAAQDEFDRIVKQETQPKTVVDISAPPEPVNRKAAPSALTLCDLANQYLADKKGSWSPHWYDVMNSLFSVHLTRNALGKILLADLTRTQIQQYLNDKALTCCKGIVTKLRTHMNAMLERAVDDDLIPKNRMRKIDMPKLRKVDQTILTKEEMAYTLTGSTGRDAVVLPLSICMGLRPSEIFALRVNDYESKLLKIDEASVNGIIDDPKTDESAGYVFMPDIVRKRMAAWIKQNDLIADDLLFAGRTGKPLRQNNYVRRQLLQIAKDLKIPKITFQICRRSFATHIQDHAKLKELQGAMRHASADTSLNVYAKERAAMTAHAVGSLTREVLSLAKTKKR